MAPRTVNYSPTRKQLNSVLLRAYRGDRGELTDDMCTSLRLSGTRTECISHA